MQTLHGVTYVTYNDMVNEIRQNLYKIPHDIDLVVGVPRSGMLPATIISEFLCKKLTTVDDFLEGKVFNGGTRESFMHQNDVKKILVVDDTCYGGHAIQREKDKLSKLKNIEVIYMVVFMEKRSSINKVDIFLTDLSNLDRTVFDCILYEWNIFGHYYGATCKYLCDLDGVFCLDPPDEKNTEEYEAYIRNAKKLMSTLNSVGGIMTYRMIKYKDVTEKWLHDNDIKYDNLFMFNSDDYDERGKVPPYVYKGAFYRDNEKYKLFIESDKTQAMMISQISGKAVYCVENNTLY